MTLARVLVAAVLTFVLRGGARLQVEDVAASSGVDFILQRDASADKVMIETMTGGGALFAYHNDGKLDVCFVNGAGHHSLQNAGMKSHNSLYRNERRWKSTEVTDRVNWTWLAALWRNWESSLVILRPETVLG